jgi:predicted transcriptional regulator
MKNTLGDQELDLLRFIELNQPISVREVSDRYEAGLARTTILTMMERLRKKDFLQRTLKDGIYVYRTVQRNEAVLRNLVGDFVAKTLGGSVTPFVAYLSDAKKLSNEEIRQLREALDRMQDKS